MNVLIPMAGAGRRFADSGYALPKPLIDVRGKPMIQRVVSNINVPGHFIFVVQQEHCEAYDLGSLLRAMVPGCQIVRTDGVTEGAACTTLLARRWIDNESPLLIANSDQFVDWDRDECLAEFTESGIDGGILTFPSVQTRWSYARLDDAGLVVEVAEKRPISAHATVGIYYWRRGSDYVRFAEQMIRRDRRVNGEFYVCPVFNEAIEAGRKIRVKPVRSMWGLGTPDDLRHFLQAYQGAL